MEGLIIRLRCFSSSESGETHRIDNLIIDGGSVLNIKIIGLRVLIIGLRGLIIGLRVYSSDQGVESSD
jgi:hypothetical protein